MRQGTEYEVRDYYSINPDEFTLNSPTPRTFGTLLHKVKDAEAIEFLKRHKNYNFFPSIFPNRFSNSTTFSCNTL